MESMNHIVIKKVHFDYALLIVTALLVMIGVVMVYSSSAVLAQEYYHDSYHFLKKEVTFCIIGFGAMMVMIKIPYKWLRKAAYPLLGITMLLLLLAFVPGIKSVVSGASRWIRIGSFSFQPSELAKLITIIFLAYALEKKSSKIKTFGMGFLPQALVVAMIVMTILAQRDFGAAFVIMLIAAVMMYISGVRSLYLAGAAVSLIPVVYFLVASVGYRRQRILSFLNPWNDRYGSGFQIIQSLVSFNEGGVMGSGLGEGVQKLFYLPEAHTDFIFAVLGEELGLIGVMTVILMFAFLIWRAVMITSRTPDLFSKYLAFGITTFIAAQVLLNICVVMGLLPTKGLVLPFISYGGSALVTMLMSIGILLNISSHKLVKSEE